MACEGCTCGATSIEQAEDQLQQAQKKLDALLNKNTRLRSKEWFANMEHPDTTALYVERYLNYGLTLPELNGKHKPIIGIAQTGSDLAPCNRHHTILAQRVRDGIIARGGTPMEFPCHPIQETGKRPTASLDRNLAYLSLVEVLYGYPLDGVVLLTGCDKTTPALLMAASTVNIPAICLNVGPMLNGYHNSQRTGAGTVIWKSRKELAEGRINEQQFMDAAASSAPSPGHCNTMGTASTMNAMAEALGMALPRSASIPAPYRERSQVAYLTGMRAVELVWEDIKPSDILTRDAFENAIAANSGIGGSTNAPIHLNAIAKHIGVELNNDDWENFGYDLPLLVNVQPAGEYLCEEYHRAGGLPAVIYELIANGKFPHPQAKTVNGCTWEQNVDGCATSEPDVIRKFDDPLVSAAGFLNMKGSLFDSAIMKTSVISKEFKQRFLSNPDDPNAFEGPVAVFDGPEDYHARVDKIGMTPGTILIMRGTGPKGYPGAAEVVNMQPSAELIKKGVTELPCLGDGRQSGTSGSPSILNASPEAASGGMLAYIKDGDKVRVDLNKRSVDVLLAPEEIEDRKKKMGSYSYPVSQTPWQEIFRNDVSELSDGMVLKSAVKYQRVAQRGLPRDSH